MKESLIIYLVISFLFAFLLILISVEARKELIEKYKRNGQAIRFKPKPLSNIICSLFIVLFVIFFPVVNLIMFVIVVATNETFKAALTNNLEEMVEFIE